MRAGLWMVALAVMAVCGCQTTPMPAAMRLAPVAPAPEADDVPPLYGLLDATTSCAVPPYALFAKSGCTDLSITGGGNRVEGDAHTNRQLRIAGNTNVVTGRAESVQGVDLRGKDNSVGSQPVVPAIGFPYRVPMNALTPTFTFSGDVNLNQVPWVWDAPGKLKPGVYVALGRLEIAGSDVSGTVTLIASSIQLHGARMALQPYTKGILGYATGQGIGIDVSSEGGQYEGFLLAPSSRFQLTGARNTLRGMVMAYSIQIAGSDNTIAFQDEAGICTASPEPSPPVGGEVIGVVSTIAGHHDPGQCACSIPFADGLGAEAGLRWPEGIEVDSRGNLIIGDWGTSAVRKMTPAGQVTTLAGADTHQTTIIDGVGAQARFAHLGSVTVAPDGMIYAIDADKIRRVHPLTGEVTTIAGGPPPSFNTGGAYVDGPAMQARFSVGAGIAADANGHIYVADDNNSVIRRLDLATGLVSTLCGKTAMQSWGLWGDFGYMDGAGQTAQFKNPQDIALGPDGNLYVADTWNHAIRKVTPEGVVSTLAGDPSAVVWTGNIADPPKGFVDGVGKAARFNTPHGLTVDHDGNVYVADTGNHAIRKITPDGRVTTVAGVGASGQDNGLGYKATFGSPYDVAVDKNHVLYVTDHDNCLIRRIQ